MRIVGKRKQRQITFHVDPELFHHGCLFNDNIHRLPTGNQLLMAKGVYRYHNHEAANQHWEEMIIKSICHAEQNK